MSNLKKHPTYIINLKERIDRKEHCINVFSGHPEFDVEFFDAIKDNIGAQGLFKSYQNIARMAIEKDEEYIIICEDDHCFTTDYTSSFLNFIIKDALSRNCDILLGGPSNIHDALFASNNIYWTGGFSGLQFAIIFKQFYKEILKYSLPQGENLDLALGRISNKIFGCYPTISYQISFGYSDVTTKNNNRRIEDYFENCQLKLERLCKVSKYFGLI